MEDDLERCALRVLDRHQDVPAPGVSQDRVRSAEIHGLDDVHGNRLGGPRAAVELLEPRRRSSVRRREGAASAPRSSGGSPRPARSIGTPGRRARRRAGSPVPSSANCPVRVVAQLGVEARDLGADEESLLGVGARGRDDLRVIVGRAVPSRARGLRQLREAVRLGTRPEELGLAEPARDARSDQCVVQVRLEVAGEREAPWSPRPGTRTGASPSKGIAGRARPRTSSAAREGGVFSMRGEENIS